MADHQELRESIRTFLAGVDQTNTPEMAEAAAEYAARCREANDRLRRCVDYLRRGHRTEAIHLAECHPKLLDVSAALDIPELADWETLCAGYGWTRPPRILVDAAQELNEAYALEQELAPVLARHRRLALEGAPLGERLSVLRELTASDPTNEGWEADVTAYEQVRVRELKGEAQTLIRQRDLVGIDRVLAEVSDGAWRTAVPIDVVDGLSRASRSLHRELARQELRGMVPELRQAHAAASYGQCRAVVDRWCEIVRAHDVLVPDDLKEEIRPVNEWLADQEDLRARRRNLRAACDDLRHALDADAPATELQRLHREANRFELDLPEDLEREYKAKLADYAGYERNRRQALLLVLALVMAAAVVAVWLCVRMILKPAGGG